MQHHSAVDKEAQTPSAWYFLGVLTILYMFSFIDRFILALLADPISKDIAITEVQLGLLIGANFAIVYAVAGFPLAVMIDRGNRRNIIAAGAVTWGICTVVSAMADSFAVLAVSRIGVAIGEATLTPAVISLIADLFPRERRILPMAIYNGVGGAMTKGVYLIGAGAIALAGVFPVELGIVPWRMTLILVGVPPILLGLLLATTVAEPRRKFPPAQGGRAEDTKAFVRELRGSAIWYVPFYLSCAASATMIYALTTWTPTLLVRAYGLSLTQSGASYGMIGMTMGLLGAAAWPALVSLLRRRGRSDAIPISMLTSSVGVIPFLLLYSLAGPNLSMLFIGAGGFGFMTASLVALAPLALQTHAPPTVHARLIALMILTISMVGLSTGSFLVPWFASHWEGDPLALGRGIAMVGMVMLPIVMACNLLFWVGLVRRQREEALQAQAPVTAG